MTWSSFLGLSSATDPNNDTGSIFYDATARPSSVTSPYGAVTTYTYNDTASPPTSIATTNGHWVETVMDGFGRAIQTITGYGSTTLSTVDTQYAPCGCSPLGKLKPAVPALRAGWKRRLDQVLLRRFGQNHQRRPAGWQHNPVSVSGQRRYRH